MDVKNIIKSLVGHCGAVKGSRRPLVAICVGHSRNGDQGASSVSGESEWNYNKKVSEALRIELENRSINSVVFTKYDADGYTGAMTWLAAQLEILKVDFAVELHFNCSESPQSHGYEFLYWNTSKKSERIAQCFEQVFKKRYPDELNRGSKGLNHKDRGALFLRLPSMPSVILEPFFGSNPKEWEFFKTQGGIKVLGAAYGEAVELGCRSLSL